MHYVILLMEPVNFFFLQNVKSLGPLSGVKVKENKTFLTEQSIEPPSEFYAYAILIHFLVAGLQPCTCET